MATQAALGKKALDDRKWDEAIKQYTIALKSSKSPLWLIQRSTAYHRLGDYQLALEDADSAVIAAVARARRELIGQAQFRRAIALFGLHKYADARLCFIWCRKLNEKEKGLGMWQAKVAKEFDGLPEDSPDRISSVQETPRPRAEASQPSAPEDIKPKNSSNSKSTPQPSEEVAKDKKAVAAQPVPITQTPKDKIRHEWYQSTGKVSITIFAKGVPKDRAEIDIHNRSLSVSFPIVASETTFDFTMDPLFAEIDPSLSTYSITANKIDISLHKSMDGIKWSALEGQVDEAQKSTTTQVPVKSETSTSDKAPSYPTSSKSGAKDWDKVAADSLKKQRAEKAAEDSAEEDKHNDDADDDEGGDPLQGFFSKIFKDADPDTKRAMMKSFTESNGTSLSTNWDDVKSKKVETHPPDGVEAKKWES